MVGGPWLLVLGPRACGSTLGISLGQSFIQIAANGNSEPKLPQRCIAANGGLGETSFFRCFCNPRFVEVVKMPHRMFGNVMVVQIAYVPSLMEAAM